MRKFKQSGTMMVHHFELRWYIRHWGGASNAYENHRGISVGVCAEPGQTKELLVEFAFTDYFFDAPPQKGPFELRLRLAIETAIEQGWRPTARGKPYIYHVPAMSQQSVATDGAKQRD